MLKHRGSKTSDGVLDTFKAIENTELELEIAQPEPGKKTSFKISGGLISAVTPVFTRDSKYLFTARSSQIQLWSIATGECVRILDGHKDAVTSFELNPLNSLQLYSASLDGTIVVWDFQEGIPLKTIKVQFPIERILFSAATPDVIYYVTRHAPKRSKTGYVHRLYQDRHGSKPVPPPGDMDIADDQPQGPILMIKRFAENSDWSINSEGTIVSAIFDKCLVLFNVKDMSSHTYDWVRDLTCVSFHPSEACVATGDCVGQVVLWYYLDSDGQYRSKPKTQIQHWHAYGVSCLSFHPDGNFLLTGGEEGVLVIWQVATQERRFMPRIGGKLLSIRMSQDASLYAIATHDNSIRIFDSVTLETVRVLAGLMQAMPAARCKPYPCRIVVEPQSKLVALNGLPGTLQFFNILQDRLEFDHAVVPRNFVMRNADRLVHPTVVERVAFSENGEWMMTLEHRNDHRTQSERRLKFWRNKHETMSKERYELNTIIDPPHHVSASSIDFHPSSIRALSSGDDCFKIWAYSQGDSNKDSHWSCHSICSFRQLKCTSAKFSRDGSLVAAAFGSFATLWNPVTSEMLHALPLPTPSEDIKFVGFLGSSPYLLVASFDFVYVWNLLSLTLVWSVQVYAKRICVDKFGSDRFAFLTITPEEEVKHHIVVYSPSSPQPLKIMGIPTAALALAFVPSFTGSKKGDLVYFDERLAFNVAVIDEDSSKLTFAKPAVAPLESNVTTQQQAAFARVFGAASQAVAKVKPNRKQSHNATTPLSDLFNAPTHVLPTTSTLATKFFDIVLPSAEESLQSNTESRTGTASPSNSTHGSQVATSASDPLSIDTDRSDDEDESDVLPPSQATSVTVASTTSGSAALREAAVPSFDFMLAYLVTESQAEATNPTSAPAPVKAAKTPRKPHEATGNGKLETPAPTTPAVQAIEPEAVVASATPRHKTKRAKGETETPAAVVEAKDSTADDRKAGAEIEPRSSKRKPTPKVFSESEYSTPRAKPKPKTSV